MEDFDEAVARFRRVYETLFDLLGNYPVDLRETSGACGVWSPRETVAHLSGWLAEAQRRYSQFDDHISGNMDYDLDAFNAESVAARSYYGWNSTIAELRGLVQDLIHRAEAIPHERRAADLRYREWLVALAQDCTLHEGQLTTFAQTYTG